MEKLIVAQEVVAQEEEQEKVTVEQVSAEQLPDFALLMQTEYE